MLYPPPAYRHSAPGRVSCTAGRFGSGAVERLEQRRNSGAWSVIPAAPFVARRCERRCSTRTVVWFVNAFDGIFRRSQRFASRSAASLDRQVAIAVATSGLLIDAAY
jgi:hypothetical protein